MSRELYRLTVWILEDGQVGTVCAERIDRAGARTYCHVVVEVDDHVRRPSQWLGPELYQLWCDAMPAEQELLFAD